MEPSTSQLRALYVEGLTLEELRAFLTEQFRTYVIDPQVYVRPVAYRPIRVYVGGEVKRPGYYTLSGDTEVSTDFQPTTDANSYRPGPLDITRPGLGQQARHSQPFAWREWHQHLRSVVPNGV